MIYNIKENRTYDQVFGDVAGALQRPVLREADRAELEAERASAVGILDREIGFMG